LRGSALAAAASFLAVRYTFRSDSFEEHASRFIVWILGDELAGQGFREDGLTETGRTAADGIYRCLSLGNYR
jgi:hypothetical protein